MLTSFQKIISCLFIVFCSLSNTFAQWQNVGQPGFSDGGVGYTSLAFSNTDEPYVVFKDYAHSGKASVMKFNGSSWVYVGQPGFSASNVNYLYTTIAFSNTGEPYIAFRDNSNSNKATVMKFDGSSWVVVGQAGFTAGGAAYTTIKFSGNGTPYLAYVDDFNSNKASVMKFDGTTWVNVGSPAFSSGIISWITFAFSNTDEPYVGFWDNTYGGKATVMKFDGTNWVIVGQPGFSAGEARENSLAFNNSGEPYLAYSDYANSFKASVMKFDGTTWANVGPAGFTSTTAGFTKIAFNNGVPYLAYSANTNASVMKFDGTSWIHVGLPAFSAGAAQFISFAFNSVDEPYIAYEDNANANKATVMKYVTPSGVNDLPAFWDNISMYPNPASDFVKISGLSGNTSVTVTDVTGRQLYFNQSPSSDLHIDTEKFLNGMYFVGVESKGEIRFRKLLINR